MTITAAFAFPFVRAAIAGALAAAAVDLAAFRAWHSFNEVLTYDWKLAAFRWAQGALVGAISAFGFTSL